MECKVQIYIAETNKQFSLIETWLAQERIWKYLGPPFTNGAYKRIAMTVAVNMGRSKFFIVKCDDVSVGLGGISNIDHINKCANCWYALGDVEYAGKGVMRTACGLIVDWSFEHLELNSIYAWAVAPNAPSHSILEANGFTRYGIQRQAFMLEGEFVDIFWYDQLRDK